ncbi:hypothetical protein VC83_02962 [Pseudogymnoascus destructans]|uniref:Rhodopsin domain-containing protein n=2 Tax=Pseudogymnoascus destructans TaxID=655981 RepID=L8G6Y7_PSED2|nr:uncharacterized protein VC83_02962 [Pseudogymnoascus destructans]ELR07746.1 hypothetical protein GMDG_08543 [Pseudogymnoascus destructans 20631-21]OAF60243.1 hypothetical protein VC83_02962 [Pseudogymnoascus destructans]
MSDPQAAAAIAEDLRDFNTELWTLYAFGVAITSLRTFARVKAVGFRDLGADDFIVWIAILLYTTQSTLAYFAVNHGQGLANNSMTDGQRAALDVNSEEYGLRVFGSKIQLTGWTCYCCLIFTLKMAVLVFYVRLMEGLSNKFRIRIWVGFGIVLSTFLASIITIYAACRPLHKYWQINPDPGNVCQGAIARPIVWVTFISSVLTDIYLIMIPIPMLWGTKLRMAKKIAMTMVLGAGLFVLVCSLLKTIFVIVDAEHGAELAGRWGTREAFVSVITTNVPMIFPLVRAWLKPLLGSGLFSSHSPSKNPVGFRTIGGGYGGSNKTGGSRGRNKLGPYAANGLSVSESEERIFQNVKMQNISINSEPVSELQRPKAIVVNTEFRMTEERYMQDGENNSGRGNKA